MARTVQYRGQSFAVVATKSTARRDRALKKAIDERIGVSESGSSNRDVARLCHLQVTVS